MTKATLFDSFYASHHYETLNYVVDCADSPCCPFFKQQAHPRVGQQGEERGFAKMLQTPGQLGYNWPDRFVFKQAFFPPFLRAISQHVMLEPDHFVISNISKHLAQKKTPQFVPGI